MSDYTPRYTTDELRKLSSALSTYIDSSPTAFHAAEYSALLLEEAGAVRLEEGEPWKLEKGRKYYVVRDGSAVMAFSTGSFTPWQGVSVAGTHLDSPLLKLKGSAFQSNSGRLTAGIEVYGGPVYATWLDRDLKLAGRYVFQGKHGLEARNFVLEQSAAIIPNVAIHMNREINKSLSYNPQTELRALILQNSSSPSEDVKDLLAQEHSLEKDAILDVETFLVPAEQGHYFISEGGDSLFTSGRIDNLAASHAALSAFIELDPSAQSRDAVLCLYNSEEIGSRTRSGAAGRMFESLFTRYLLAAGLSEEERIIARQNSFQISVDAAHALHPNYADKHDPMFRPELNRGVALKRSAAYKYGTDALVASRFIDLMNREKLPLQEMVNRADVPSGSTIGTISMSLSDIPTVDIGIPMLAMHSARETAGLEDQMDSQRLLFSFFRDSVKSLD
ncbi:M18 family aminopeptidase [Salinispira pacifica]|uniref:M18 family aminopeptidase n=1 Tax=Salinispira pacifica TaxID=1307761 RepID=V5WI65_9SPIO|nr:M18 family aminopeptidase [Salinispira pacifica]AHC15320.1 Putative aminopeptidase [Salinispira pacifica]